MTQTLRVVFDDTPSVITRKLLLTKDVNHNNRGSRKLRVKAQLLAWLERSYTASVTVSQLLSSMDDSLLDEPDHGFLFVTDKLPGTTVLSQSGSFVLGISSEPGNDVVPTIAVHTYRVTRVFNGIRERFGFLLKMKKHSTSINGNDGGRTDELGFHINALLGDLESTGTIKNILRCALSHEDLNDSSSMKKVVKLLVSSIGKQYQMAKFAILAAD
ncbi:hypothetical protein DXG01_006897 [Tephrocybe rancida]|nr:hypothetical protein DXG01_006897 [Tephrocybe rancida]